MNFLPILCKIVDIGQLSVKDGIHIKRDKNKEGISSSDKPKKNKSIVAGIIAGAVVVILAAGTGGAGFYINKLDTIYPNITVGGVDLSGMTLDQAEKALSNAGFEKTASNVSVTVNFPDGEKLTTPEWIRVLNCRRLLPLKSHTITARTALS